MHICTLSFNPDRACRRVLLPAIMSSWTGQRLVRREELRGVPGGTCWEGRESIGGSSTGESDSSPLECNFRVLCAVLWVVELASVTDTTTSRSREENLITICTTLRVFLCVFARKRKTSLQQESSKMGLWCIMSWSRMCHSKASLESRQVYSGCFGMLSSRVTNRFALTQVAGLFITRLGFENIFKTRGIFKTRTSSPRYPHNCRRFVEKACWGKNISCKQQQKKSPAPPMYLSTNLENI